MRVYCFLLLALLYICQTNATDYVLSGSQYLNSSTISNSAVSHYPTGKVINTAIVLNCTGTTELNVIFPSLKFFFLQKKQKKKKKVWRNFISVWCFFCP